MYDFDKFEIEKADIKSKKYRLINLCTIKRTELGFIKRNSHFYINFSF